MTFRHRHFGQGGLIGTAEVEPEKAETAERKKKGVRRMKVQSDPSLRKPTIDPACRLFPSPVQVLPVVVPPSFATLVVRR